METITHREMRNNSAEVLRRVAAGESFTVTNNGTEVALLSPVRKDESRRAQLIAEGKIIPAMNPQRYAPNPQHYDGPPSEELIAELRGRW